MKYITAISALFVQGALLLAQPVQVEGLQGLGDTRHHVVESKVLHRRYDIFVGLPEDYDAERHDAYPTMYILDGGELYPLLLAYHHYLQVGGEAPKMILVAISYGTRDWQAGNDRSHDYTAPSAERDFWGGAGDFQQFLSSELLPFIEGNYHARGDRRAIFGQSIGGQFVLYTAQTEPALFWGHIASNPALHRNLPYFLQLHAEPSDDITSSSLYVGSGSDDDPRFRGPALLWIEHWTNEKQKPWRLKAETLEGHSHFSAPPAAYRQGVRWLFADYIEP